MDAYSLTRLYEALKELCEIGRHTLEISVKPHSKFTFWWNDGAKCTDFEYADDAIEWAETKVDNWLAS